MTTAQPYLFGIDLDGTLLDPHGLVTPRTRAAVQAVLAAGHRVCFATGRNLLEAREVFRSVGHEAVCVLVSGAITQDATDGRVLHRGHMDARLAGELCTAIEDVGEAALAYQDRDESEADYFVSADKPVHPSQLIWFESSGQKVVRPPSMAAIDHSKTLRVNCICGYAAAARVRTAVAERFAGRVYLHSIVVPRENAEIIELFDPAVNKWQGLTRVADGYGIPHDRIVAAGDDTNDLPMLRAANPGVAMGNARSEVKQAAKRIIGRNEADGLAVFLEEWLAAQANR